MINRFILLIFGIVVVCGCSGRTGISSDHVDSESEQNDTEASMVEWISFEDYIENNYDNLNIRFREKGNFTGSTFNEEIVFFEDPKRRLNRGDENKITDVYLFVYSAEGVIEEKRLSLFTLPYTESEKKAVLRSAKIFNVEPKPFFTLDLNNNGRAEIYFFVLDGIGFGVVGIEYYTDEFKMILDGSKYTKILNTLELIKETDNGSVLRLVGEGNAQLSPGQKDWYELAWDNDETEYVLIDQGIQ